MKKTIILGGLLIFILAGCSLPGIKSGNKKLSAEDAKVKVEEFINTNLMAQGTTAVINEITEEAGLYKLAVDISQGKVIDSYMTKDGRIFFPEAIIMEKEEVPAEGDTPSSSNSQPVAQAETKSDKPAVELFVMSHCPYGTQIEKGIIPVVKTLGNKIDFDLKFVNYAMHGQKEIDEQVNQYCIDKNEPTKLISYLECFLEAGDGQNCLTKTSINTSSLTSCVAQADKQFKLTENYNDKNTWKGTYPPFNIYDNENQQYQISGSPALVINGSKISASRDSQSLLSTICSAFNNPPAECGQTLSSTSPAPGFGFGGEGSGAAADCGE